MVERGAVKQLARLARAWFWAGVSVWSTTSAAQAARPGCVELTIPGQLPMGASWHNLVQQETRALLDEQTSACAHLEVVEEAGAGAAPLLLQVDWAGSVRAMPLDLSGLAEAERPRAAALLARGLLQQVIAEHDGQPEAPAPTGEAAPTEPDGLPSWDRTEAARPSSASQLTPPRPGTTTPPRKRSAWDDYAWQPIAKRDDRFAAPERTERTSPWSGSLLGGSAVALDSLTPMFQLELGVQRLVGVPYARVGLAAHGVYSPMEVTAGGPGLRTAIDFRLLHYAPLRLWLGPGLSFTQLLILTNGADYSARYTSTIAGVDARATLELAVSRRAFLTLALELAYALRYLRVVTADQTVFAYEGLLLALRVGVGF